MGAGRMGETTEVIIHLTERTRRRCESCGDRANVKLEDGSTWCDDCDGSAREMGY